MFNPLMEPSARLFPMIRSINQLAGQKVITSLADVLKKVGSSPHDVRKCFHLLIESQFLEPKMLL